MILKTKDDMHTIHLELGETLHVTFDPAGVNAVAGTWNEVRGITIGTVQLGFEMGLSILPEREYFYEGIYSGSNVKGWYVYATHGRPKSVTFDVPGVELEPGKTLMLKRLDI